MRHPSRTSRSMLALVVPLLCSVGPSHAWVATSGSIASSSRAGAQSLHAIPKSSLSYKRPILLRAKETSSRDVSLEATPTSDADFGLSLQQAEERTRRVNGLALLNGSIVSLFAFGALYSLFHVDAEALVALWTYDLGPHSPDVTKAAVAMDLLARLPMDAIHAYEGLIPTNPIFYKACTSGIAYGLGDFISQVYQGKTLETLDLPRAFRSAAAGFLCHGPLCHFWLLFMETYLDFDGAWWATGIKVAADLTVWSIFLNAAYSTIIGLLAGRDPREVLKDVKLTLWPALRSAWTFWPWVHTISFSHAVPLDLKLLWVDVMEIVWVTMLSKVANEDKNAQLEKNATLVNQCGDEDVDFGVMPELEVELTRQRELPDKFSQKGAFLQDVASSVWPLIAMWPVLWAGYQVEHMWGLVS